jgi:hypothetical protein
MFSPVSTFICVAHRDAYEELGKGDPSLLLHCNPFGLRWDPGGDPGNKKVSYSQVSTSKSLAGKKNTSIFQSADDRNMCMPNRAPLGMDSKSNP